MLELDTTVVINPAIKTIFDSRPDWLLPELVGRLVARLHDAPRPWVVLFENAPDTELLAFAESELVAAPDVDRVVQYETAIAIWRRGRTRIHELFDIGPHHILRSSYGVNRLIRDWRSYEVTYYVNVHGRVFDAQCRVSVAEP